MRALWISIAFAGLAACHPRLTSVGGGSAPGKGNFQGEPPDVSAAVAVKAYVNNRKRADHTYNDRSWIITDFLVGEIDGAEAWMNGPGKRVQLIFASHRDVVRFSTGAIISARCEGDGQHGDYIRFEDCTLRDVRPNYIEPASGGDAESADGPGSADSAEGG